MIYIIDVEYHDESFKVIVKKICILAFLILKIHNVHALVKNNKPSSILWLSKLNLIINQLSLRI